MSQVFDPYSSWLDIPPRDHPPDHYALLGVSPFEPDQRVIREAARQRADRIRRHGTGEHAEICQRILHDLSAATGCLLDPGKKSDYDKSLREAQKMDDTRSMSGADLEVEAEGVEPKPLRWGDVAAKESSTSSPRSLSNGQDRDEPDADSQSSFGSDSSSGGSSSGLAAVDAALGDDRQPLINVLVVSSGVGILLVAALGLVIGILVTGRTNSAGDESPDVSSYDLENEINSPALPSAAAGAGNASSESSSVSPNDSAATASDEMMNGDSASSAISLDTTTGEQPAGSNTAEEAAVHSTPDSSVPPPALTRLPLPPVAEHAGLRAQVEAEFGADQLVTRGEFLGLVERLIEQAGGSSASPDRQFGLLLTAAQLAGRWGDPVLAFIAADRLRTIFDIDESQIKSLLGEVIGQGYDEGKLRWQRFVAAREVLAVNPDDPPANLEIGRYYCFLRDDWTRGLPHLAGGENTALRLLAERELAENGMWQQRLELGDNWWMVSLVADPEAKAAEQERAARWYRLALPDLDGADKRRVQSRLASLIALPGSVAPPDSDETSPERPSSEADGDSENTSTDGQPPANLSGTWRSGRFGTVFRLEDRGSTVRCEVVSSAMVQHVDGLWIREDGRLLCDRWRFRFVEDPDSDRTWELGCEPKVVDEKTILLRAEVVEWDSRGRETDRRWETATWTREAAGRR